MPASQQIADSQIKHLCVAVLCKETDGAGTSSSVENTDYILGDLSAKVCFSGRVVDIEHSSILFFN